MDFIKCNNLTYYHDSFENDKDIKIKALDNISLNIKKGEFVAILGHNGSGKSTFSKILNGLLLPPQDTVFVNGLDCGVEENLLAIRQRLGMVFQNPDNQIVSSIVEDEVAFGCENLGLPSSVIRQRVDFALKKVDMYEYRNHIVSNLSGGQKQRVAIASILAMKPEGIIFDEATAMLDPEGRQEVLSIIEELHREGITIIYITHYMEEVINADRIYVFNKGQITMEGTPKEVFANSNCLVQNHLELPLIVKLARDLGYKDCNSAYDIADKLLNENINNIDYKDFYTKANQNNLNINNSNILNIENISYSYASGDVAVDNVSANIKEGELICIVGATGSGKSTFIQLLNGLYKSSSGSIKYKGKDIKNIKDIKQKIGIIFQYPEDQIFEATVFDEVAFAPKNMKLSQEEINKRVIDALDFVNIDKSYYNKSPLNLSGGEKRKIVIASVLAMKPNVIVLDEPIAGLDPQGRADIIKKLKELTKNNITVIMVIHSMDIACEIADRILAMAKGKIIGFDNIDNVFKNCDIPLPEVAKVCDILNQKGVKIPYGYTYESARYILKRAFDK